MKNKTEKSKVKKPIYKKWWFWVIIVVILAAIFGNSGGKEGFEDGVNDTLNSSVESTQEPEQETESESTTLSAEIDGGCRALTKRFVEGVVEEDYSAFAYSVEEFEIDENENGTIKVLYLPSNAGTDGATKVNLTITLKDGTYTIEYAMLSGLYEVDLTQVSKEYTELATSD